MSKARELSKLPNYVLSTVAELKLSVGKEQGDKAFVGGYYADGDGGGGDFYWDAVSVETDNGGTIVQVTGVTTGRWKRIYSGSVNIKWFSSLQSALNTGLHVLGNKIDTYQITDTLTILTPAQKVNLNGATVNLNDATGLKSHIKIGDGITQVNGVELDGITFTRTQVATSGYAIETDYCGVVKIKNCRIYGDNKIFSGIRLYKCTVSNIENNYIQNCVSKGLSLQGTNNSTLRTVDTTIINNRIEGGVTAIDCYDFVEGFFCRNNILFNTSSSALSINASSDANGLYSFKIQHNDFDTCGGYGIYIDAVSSVQITDNWFSSITGSYALGVKSLCDSVIVSDNQMYPSVNGVLVEGINVSIHDNLVSGGSGSLVVLGLTATRNSVLSNKLLGGAYAFNFVSGYDGGLILDNTMYAQSSGTTNNMAGTTNLTFKDNKGDTVIGDTNFITLGASPYTYTSGARPEMVSVFGGTVSNIQTGGNSIGFTSNRTLVLAPNTSTIVTYSSVPFMTKTYL